MMPFLIAILIRDSPKTLYNFYNESFWKFMFCYLLIYQIFFISKSDSHCFSESSKIVTLDAEYQEDGGEGGRKVAFKILL